MEYVFGYDHDEITFTLTAYPIPEARAKKRTPFKTKVSLRGRRRRGGKGHSRPQSLDPSDLRQRSRALAGTDFLSMCRVIVSYSQPIRFVRFDGKSVNRGLPVLDKARALDLCRRSEGSWLWGREWGKGKYRRAKRVSLREGDSRKDAIVFFIPPLQTPLNCGMSGCHNYPIGIMPLFLQSNL